MAEHSAVNAGTEVQFFLEAVRANSTMGVFLTCNQEISVQFWFGPTKFVSCKIDAVK